MVLYAETGKGCCLRTAKSLAAGKSAILKEVGTDVGVTVCRKATPRDIAWVRGMGGYVPKEAKKP